MTPFSEIANNWIGDVDLHYRSSCRRRPQGVRLAAAFLNPAVVAATLFRFSANSSGLAHLFARWLTLSLFASDISAGARIEGSIEVPHPTGIVIGHGAVIGNGTRIFQNVTIGSSRKGEYPVIGKNVTIYSGAVIAGGLTIGDEATIGANCMVTRSVASSDVVRSK